MTMTWMWLRLRCSITIIFFKWKWGFVFFCLCALHTPRSRSKPKGDARAHASALLLPMHTRAPRPGRGTNKNNISSHLISALLTSTRRWSTGTGGVCGCRGCECVRVGSVSPPPFGGERSLSSEGKICGRPRGSCPPIHPGWLPLQTPQSSQKLWRSNKVAPLSPAQPRVNPH